MSNRRIADLLNVAPRFLRSVHLERDFNDSSILHSYVPTDFAQSCFGRIIEGLRPESGQRAWRMTGDYGSGKSSFALLLAHSFSGRNEFPARIRKAFDFQLNRVHRPRFVPVLSTCSRRSLSVSILEALYNTLCRLYARGARLKLALEVEASLRAEREPTEEQLLALIQKVNAQIISDAKGSGLLLILDELGKFLEFAAQNSHRHDVFLLQHLAEAASRSGDKPLFIVCLLHQGFNSYAEGLDQSAQREWEKVAGRFDEIVFNQPPEQIAQLIATALNVRVNGIPMESATTLRRSMKEMMTLGWFGGVHTSRLVDTAVHLFPLHPTVLPVLIRIFRRFGQNERSLFSFLLSSEPFGLRMFSEAPLRGGDLFRLHNLYDYVRTCFGHRLSVLSYRSNWSLIDSVIESFSTSNELHIKILKTIGILNLLNDSDLVVTEEAVVCALAGIPTTSAKQIKSALNELRHGKKVLYDRGRLRGMCLWPHTSVDLEKALEEARKTVVPAQRVSSQISDYLQARPIVARRHYIKTGNLRYFDVHYCAARDLPDLHELPTVNGDGVVIVPLCETETERVQAVAFAKKAEMEVKKNWLVAVPQPLSTIASLMQEVQRWDWVSINTLELNADRYAREEVSRQKEAARSQLERRIQTLVGLRQHGGEMSLEWFHCGERIKIKDSRELVEELSRICDSMYDQAPKISNELINRRSLSSAAAAARMRLIERMFLHQDKPYLGMTPEKKPPEMSMYLSVLAATGIHQKNGDLWQVSEPSQKSDGCRVLPVLRRMREIVRSQGDERVSIPTLFEDLRQPPYGVRDGLLPIFLTVCALSYEQDIAFYKDGTFLREMNAEGMLLLSKAPERFEVQYCRIEGVRAEIYHKLSTVLEIKPNGKKRVEVLDVVKPICVFVAKLPEYVRNTKRLSATAIAVRDAILVAREPIRLLYVELPQACGLSPFVGQAASSSTVRTFVKTFKGAIDELRMAFSELHGRLREQLRSAFEYSGTFSQFRRAIAERAERVVIGVSEPKLKAFCLRLLDDNLHEAEWLESIGSYVSLVPPARWHDSEETTFNQKLAELATRFKHVESIVFGHGNAYRNDIGVRVAVTQSSGMEHERVIHYALDEESQIRALQEQFEELLDKEHRLGLAAVSRALWKTLERGGTDVH
jgi:hypothetical protein